MAESKKPKVVIIGGGFGGLWAANALGGKAVRLALIDRKNHHTFQPLLYQVATAVLSPGEIASPIRRILHRHRNLEVILGEANGFDLAARTVILADGATVEYDYLIVAAGARHSYFGNDQWEEHAPGLKTLEDAIEMRRRILFAFENAERHAFLTGVRRHLNFVVIGGGPTGVELAGAIAGIAREALARDFSLIDTKRALVQLYEGSDRILGTFDESLSKKAQTQLESLGVEVHLNSFVTGVEKNRVRVGEKWIACDVALWATGVAASPLGRMLGVPCDRAGRVIIEPDLTIPGFPEVYVIGDMASFTQADGTTVPGVAQGAMQMGEHAADNILRTISGRDRRTFAYNDLGEMATIGRSRAIAEIFGFKFSGFFAWLVWLFIHLVQLIGFRNRIYVLSSWFWAYLTRERNARLITGDARELE